MPAFAPITLGPTAGDMVLNPEERNNGVTTWRQTGASSISGAARVSYSLKRTPSGKSKILVKFTIPETHTDATTGIVTTKYVNFGSLELAVDNSSDSTIVAANLGVVTEMLAAADMVAAITKLENFY